jgi:hypothetical protein
MSRFLNSQNVLIEVNPRIRIPRTFKRFCGLMGTHQAYDIAPVHYIWFDLFAMHGDQSFVL